MGVFMVTLCAFEISAWVAYITRFTEENFALLIATIYVYKVCLALRILFFYKPFCSKMEVFTLTGNREDYLHRKRLSALPAGTEA